MLYILIMFASSSIVPFVTTTDHFMFKSFHIINIFSGSFGHSPDLELVNKFVIVADGWAEVFENLSEFLVF